MRSALAPGSTLGHYRILETLGEGGMGCVYLAEDLVLGRRAALKLIRAEDDSELMRQRLLREARAASALMHPNICTIYEAGVWEGEPFIAMQYVEGRPLTERSRQLSIDEILRVAAGVAEGLAEAHAHGIVHRDIKPQNIVVNERAVVILDFGLARSIEPQRDEQLTARDSVAGTAPYMSPEQLRHESLDGRSDVFSFGVMLYELFGGRRPFDRGSIVDTISAILREEPAPMSSRGIRAAALEALIFTMLRKRAADRPTAREIAGAIESIRRQADSGDAPTQMIGAEVTAALSRSVPPQTRTSSITNIDAEAAKLYLKARQLWKKRSPAGMRTAIALLQEAIEIEPEYARAYAALADAYTFLGFLQMTEPSAVFPKAEAAISRAIELDPQSAEAHASRGFVQTVYGWNPAAAEESFAEAIRLDPTLATAHHWRGLYLLARRRFDEADAALREASELDPLSPIFATACGFAPMYRGDAEGAIRVYRSVVESEPAFVPVHFYLGLALERCGRGDDAIAEFRTALEMGTADTEAAPALAHALARAGRGDEASAIVDRLRIAAKERFISPFFFAVAAMGARDVDGAIAALDEAVRIRAVRLSDVHLDHRFAPLRGDARFAHLLTRIGMDPEVRSLSS
jgi:tetratricopeptide (TPR) repeat protein/tRNA A-37 threonylcarbamoyl transferase component Bud32